MGITADLKNRQLFQSIVKFGDELHQRELDSTTDFKNFDEIEATLARLVFADVRLRTFELRSELFLSKISVKTHLAEELLQYLLFAAVNGFAHSGGQS
jgi:hypothetical protein